MSEFDSFSSLEAAANLFAIDLSSFESATSANKQIRFLLPRRPLFSVVIAVRIVIVGLCVALAGITHGDLVCTSEMVENVALVGNGYTGFKPVIPYRRINAHFRKICPLDSL